MKASYDSIARMKKKSFRTMGKNRFISRMQEEHMDSRVRCA